MQTFFFTYKKKELKKNSPIRRPKRRKAQSLSAQTPKSNCQTPTKLNAAQDTVIAIWHVQISDSQFQNSPYPRQRSIHWYRRFTKFLWIRKFRPSFSMENLLFIDLWKHRSRFCFFWHTKLANNSHNVSEMCVIWRTRAATPEGVLVLTGRRY